MYENGLSSLFYIEYITYELQNTEVKKINVAL